MIGNLLASAELAVSFSLRVFRCVSNTDEPVSGPPDTGDFIPQSPHTHQVNFVSSHEGVVKEGRSLLQLH